MDVKGNSIIDTVIEYASVKFGVEMDVEEVGKQLKNMNYRDTLNLVDAIKSENDEIFSNNIDLSAVTESVVDDDSIKGFDPKTQFAIKKLQAKYPHSEDLISALLADVEKNELDGDTADAQNKKHLHDLEKRLVDVIKKNQLKERDIEEAGYGTGGAQSNASIQNANKKSNIANRRANNMNQDQARAATGKARTVYGGNTQPTGTGGGQGGAGVPDPDDMERQDNQGNIQSNSQRIQNQDAEIERLKSLAGVK